jgi:hypothetical protein
VVLESFPERPDEQPHGKGELKAGRVGRILLDAGLEKTWVLKKTSQWFFWGVFGVFWDFFGFLKYICPEERVFRVFSVSRILLGASRLKIIVTLTY